MPFLSFAAYARHRGVTHTAVINAVKEGRISCSIDPNTGRRVIDPAVADEEWARNTDTTRTPHSYKKRAEMRKAPNVNLAPHPEAAKDSGVPDLTKSRAIKEAYLARLLRLEYEKKAGRLVPIDDVVKEVEREYSRVRARLLALAAKLAPEVAIEDRIPECRAIIEAAVRDALEELRRDDGAAQGGSAAAEAD